MTTTVRPTPGFLLTTTTITPVTQVSQDCIHDDQIFSDGALIKTEKACEHCYCMKGDIVCVVQECGTPMENEGKNCTSLLPRHGQCCPDTYICEGDEPITDQSPEVTTETIVAPTIPPRKSIEGSGYRNEPDEPYTDMPIFDTTEAEGSGEDQSTLIDGELSGMAPGKHTPDLEDELFLTTAKESEFKPYTSTAEPGLDLTKVPKSESSDEESSPEYEHDIATESTKPDEEDESAVNKDDNNSINKEIANKEITHVIKDIEETQEPLFTTIIDEVSSSSESLTSREDQSIITTEPSFRKEDFIPTIAQMATQAEVNEVTTQGILNDATTQVLNKEVTEKELQITEVKHDEPTTLSEVTATTEAKIIIDEETMKTTESSVIADKPESEKEILNEYDSANTLKPEVVETTSFNPIENEIDEDLSALVSSGRIPGEGDCLLNGITYKNFTTVPSTNKCHTQCRCISSIVKCDPIICSPPPEFANMNNCQPIYDSAESCCPTYICDHSKETSLPESHSQMSGTESPKPTYSSECNGDECQITKDKENVVPVQPEPCTSENCMLEEKKQEVPVCGAEGCAIDTESMPGHSEECVNSKCETPLNDIKKDSINCEDNDKCKNVQSPKVESPPCQDGICTQSPSIKDEDGPIEKECDNDSCRRKETSKDTIESPTTCSGGHCDNLPDTENILNESTTQTHLISEETTKATENDVYTTTSSIYSASKSDQEFKGTVEDDITATATYDTTSNKIYDDLQEYTTKHDEYHPEFTDSSVIKENESFTSKQPGDVNEPLIQISTNMPEILKEKEYLTTTPHNLLTEPTLTEEDSETQRTGDKISYERKDTTTTSPTIDSKPDLITGYETDKTSAPTISTTSGLHDSTLPDFEKHRNVSEDNIENTTPRLDDEKYAPETGITEPSVTEEKINNIENDLTTPSFMVDDGDFTTETLISKTEETDSKIFEEVTTKLPESQGVEQNLTEDNIKDITFTTQRNIETTKVHEISADINNINNISDHTNITPAPTQLPESLVTEFSTEDVMKQKGTSDVSDDSVVEYELNRITTEAVTVDKEEAFKTTLRPDSKVTKEEILGSEEPNHQESITEEPVTEHNIADEVTESTERDQMESLNGRGTELPNAGIEEELQTESHFLIPDTHTTENIESGIENTQTELAEHSTESSLDMSHKTITAGVVTKLPTEEENEIIKIETESSMILTTEPSRTSEVVSEVSQVIMENDDNKVATDNMKEFTTELQSSSDYNFDDEKIVDEKHKEPQEPQEITQEPEPSPTTEFLPNVDTQTEPIIDANKLSTSDSEDLKPEESLSTTAKPIDKMPEEHEIEISTSKLYPKFEDETETFTESLDEVTQQTEGSKAVEEDHPIISTELPMEEFSTSKYDVPSSEKSISPETSENILQTSTSKQDKDVTEPSSVSAIKDKESAETLPSKDSSVTNEVDETTRETVTEKLEVTTNVFGISEDKKETTTSPLEQFYPHDISTESNTMMEAEIIGKATTVPQTIPEEESHTIYTENEPTLSSHISDTEDRQSTTEKQVSKIPEIESFTSEHSISTETQKEEQYTESLGVFTTETTESITEKDISSTQLKDASSEVPDFVTEIITDTHETSVTTHPPELGVSENLPSEQPELTEAPKNIYTDENTIKDKELASTEEYLTEVTESPERVTKDEVIEQVTTQEMLTTEKITEDLNQPYDGKIITESPELFVKITSGDIANDLVTNDLTSEIHKETITPEPSTEPTKILTESSFVEEDSKYTKTPDHKVNEEPSLEDKDKITEMPISESETGLPITLSPEKGTEKLSESQSVEEHEKYNTTPNEDLLTASPEVDVNEKVDDAQKLTEVPMVTDAPITKLTEMEEVTEKLENENLEKTTGDTREKDDHKTTLASEILVPVETTSHLPENESDYKDDVALTVVTEHATEISPSEPLETEDKKRITESYQSSPTSTLHDGLAKGEVSVPTESSITVGVDSTYESDVKQDLDGEKTAPTAPVLSTQPSEEDLMTSPKNEPEGTTEINVVFTLDTETNTKTETTPEKEKSESDKLSSEDKITTIGEQYTESPEEAITEKSSTDSSETLTENEITKTEIPVALTHKLDEEIGGGDGPTTQRSETETQMSVSLNTETLSSPSQGVHLSDNQVKETEKPEIQTELPTFMTHVTQKETTYKEVTQTEPPTSIATSKDEYSHVTQKIYDETTSQHKENDYITTEETPKVTESVKEMTNLPEKIAPTSKPMHEYESTPYFVELEEHTHKSIEKITSEVYHEEEATTVKLEHQYPEKEEYDITTEKQFINEQEYQSGDTAKETEITTEEDKQVATTVFAHDDFDTSHSTYSPIEKSTEQPTETELQTTPHALYTENTKYASTLFNKETSTTLPVDTTVIYEKQETPKYAEQTTSDSDKEIAIATGKPQETVSSVHETTAPEEEFILAVTKGTTTKVVEDITTPQPTHMDKFTSPQDKPIETVSSSTLPELLKPGFNDILPTDDIPSTDDDSHFPPTGTSGYGQEPDYGEEEQAFGPGTCRYGGKVYVSAQQIPRDDPCDFCFCFRSDIICLQQSCPPPIHGCHEEPIQGFCCPRYECPVSMATTLNITTTTTTTTTTLPPHFLPHAYKGAAQRRGCQIKGHTYKVGEVVRASSGPCLHCT